MSANTSDSAPEADSILDSVVKIAKPGVALGINTKMNNFERTAKRKAADDDDDDDDPEPSRPQTKRATLSKQKPRRRDHGAPPPGLTRRECISSQEYATTLEGEYLLDVLLEFHNKDIQHARGVIPSVIAHAKKRAILDRAYERGTNYKEEVDSYAQEQQMFRTYMYNHPGTSLLRGEVPDYNAPAVVSSNRPSMSARTTVDTATTVGTESTGEGVQSTTTSMQSGFTVEGVQYFPASTDGDGPQFQSSQLQPIETYQHLVNSKGQALNIEEALATNVEAFNQTHDWPTTQPNRMVSSAQSIQNMVQTGGLASGIVSPFALDLHGPSNVSHSPYGDVDEVFEFDGGAAFGAANLAEEYALRGPAYLGLQSMHSTSSANVTSEKGLSDVLEEDVLPTFASESVNMWSQSTYMDSSENHGNSSIDPTLGGGTAAVNNGTWDALHEDDTSSHDRTEYSVQTPSGTTHRHASA